MTEQQPQQPMGTGPWWVPSSSHGKAKFVTRSNALLMAGIAGLVGAVFGASSSGSLYFPPKVPSVPTKSVSQNLHTALALCFSFPDHRLQPVNLTNIAVLPA